VLIRMTVGLSGPTMTLEPGDERDFHQEEAIRLIRAGYAVPVSEPQIERAIIAPIIETRTVAPIENRNALARKRSKRNRR